MTTDPLAQGRQLHQAGRLAEAEPLYRRALAAAPEDPAILFLLGVLTQSAGRFDEAADWLARAAVADPRHVEARFLLGVVRHRQRQFPAAIEQYRAALAIEPDHVKAANNVGRAMLDGGGDPAGAVAWLRAVVDRHPAYAGARTNLGDALRVAGDLSAAAGEYTRAVALDPALTPARASLGAALSHLGRREEATVVLRAAVANDPRSAAARYNLARVLQDGRAFDEAAEQARAVVAIDLGSADGWNLLGSLLGIVGNVPGGVAAQRRAVAIRPETPGAASNLLLSLHYLADAEPAAVFAEHARRGAAITAACGPASRVREVASGGARPVRVGYVSPDFRHHSVAQFMEPLLGAHDPNAVEVYCYSGVDRPDEVTGRLQRLARWRDVARLGDDAAADMIRRDEIEVLVDLAGHTAGNRLAIFARRPAAVQMTYLGYPGSTGLPAIDFRLTDAVADPPGMTEAVHTERLVRLAGGAWAYRREGVPDGPPPATANGFVTFGSFNNLPKVTPVVLAAWARVLKAVPGSRLRVKALGLSAAAGRAHVSDGLARHGVAGDRVELLPWAGSTADHLRLYAGVDVALDTFPYNGTTTTCEALWAGVPVVAVAGATHAGRVGASLLHHAGMGELAVGSIDDYVRLAVEIGTDGSRLVAVRRALRQRLPTSPLADVARLARALEAAYRSAVGA